MQRKALSIAVAAALAAVSGSASALSYNAAADATGATGYNDANTTEVYISGSSATNGQTLEWAKLKLCKPGSDQAVFPASTSNFGSNNFAVVCKPLAAGYSKAHIAIIKNSTGGSGNGIAMLAGGGGTPQNYVNVHQTTPAIATSGQPGFGIPAAIGVSDEEYSVLAKAGAYTGSEPANLVSAALNVVTFGTPVTLKLYRALQESQIETGKLAATCRTGISPNFTYTDESEACMPSLSQSQIASILSGNLVGWTEILSLPGDPTNTDNNVYLARRGITSGTQTAARVHFLNDPCADNMLQFTPTTSAESNTKADACNAASYPGTTVYEGSGSGNVSTCLTNHDRNGRWAIGINSLEYPTTSDTSPEYIIGGGTAVTGSTVFNKNHQRHIKIEGFAPTTFNVATGRYRFWFEAAMHTITIPTGDIGLVRSAMIAGFNDPAILVPLNATFNTTALLGAGKSAGILAPVTGGTPATTATEAATTAAPLMYYTRSAISGVPNSCQPAMSFYSTGINP